VLSTTRSPERAGELRAAGVDHPLIDNGTIADQARSRSTVAEPESMPGALPLAMGVVMVPMTTAPPPVPPSVLFPEAFAVEAAAATEASAAAEAGLAATEAATVAAATEVAGGSALLPVVGWVVAG
jgi:hypothetical protein